MLDVSRLSSAEDVEKIRQEWAELQDSSETVNPFVGPEWTIHWMRSLMPDTDEAWILTVRDSGRLVGVAPMHLHTYRLGIRRLQMIGSGAPWVGPFEAPAVLAAQPHGRQVARALIEYLAARQRSWHLSTVALGESSDWLEPGWLDADFTVVAYKTTPSSSSPFPLRRADPPRGGATSRRPSGGPATGSPSDSGRTVGRSRASPSPPRSGPPRRNSSSCTGLARSSRPAARSTPTCSPIRACAPMFSM